MSVDNTAQTVYDGTVSATDHALSSHREHAAKLSGGASGDAIYNAVLNVINSRRLSGTVLDYGAGRGLLTRQLSLAARFTRIVACDIMPKPAELEATVEWVKTDLNEFHILPAATFDVVVAAEVIEHLENPRATVRQIARLLRKGGTLILTTPNNESVRALASLILRGHYVSFGDSCYPAHITALLRKDISRICRECGLTEPEFLFTESGSLPGLTRLSWQQFGPWFSGVRFSDGLVAVSCR